MTDRTDGRRDLYATLGVDRDVGHSARPIASSRASTIRT
jgi:hypothetical protein